MYVICVAHAAFYSMYNLLETEIRRIRPMYLLSERSFFFILVLFLFLLPYENELHKRARSLVIRDIYFVLKMQNSNINSMEHKNPLEHKKQIKINKFLVESQRICLFVYMNFGV